jgi:KDO2-lipid IV(A) lauroyltransferase
MILLRRMARLPLSILYLFSDILGFLAFYVLKYRYKVVIENMQKSFPEKSEKEIKKLTKQFYFNLSDWIVETLKASEMSENDLKKRVKSCLMVGYSKKSLI